MAFTFLAAQGFNVGRSLVEEDKKELALNTLKAAVERKVRIVLPVDVRSAKKFPEPIDEALPFENVQVANISSDSIGLDIGADTEKMFAEEIRRAKTVVWNGPMGVFENPLFAAGTRTVAFAIAAAGTCGALTVMGGGDSVSAAVQFNVADRLTHVSTGGGSTLEFLEGKPLPGVECLEDRD